jgi:hypothetical protein
VNHRDPGALELDFEGLRQRRPQLSFVDVAVDRVERAGAERLDLAQGRDGEEIAAVERRLCFTEDLDGALRQRPPALRHVGVGEDRDQAVPRARSMNGPSRSATEAAVESADPEGLMM